LLALTGARRSEILTLKWDYVDIGRGLINLPDSKTGHKTINLNAQAIQILSKIPKIEGNPYVICGQKVGEHLVNLRKIWIKILALAKLKNARLHDLRHSFASMGVSEGLSLPVIGGLLGHNSPATTKKYAHLAENPLKTGNDAIGNAISTAMNPGDLLPE
jgi:integrase